MAPSLPRPDPDDDGSLVARCRVDRAALHGSFRALYERHAPAVLRFLTHRVGAEAAPDCLQETFLRVYRDLERYDERRAFRGWVLGIARHVALDALRHAARRPAHPLDLDPAAPGAEATVAAASRREARGLLAAAIASLPDDQQEVFLLQRVEGLTFAEVASVVGCSLRTAKYRMAAALERLGERLRALEVE